MRSSTRVKNIWDILIYSFTLIVCFSIIITSMLVSSMPEPSIKDITPSIETQLSNTEYSEYDGEIDGNYEPEENILETI